jgi:Na+/H+ antiporter NhaA
MRKLPAVGSGAQNRCMAGQQTSGLSGRTAWARTLEAPLRRFLRTETGSAAALLAALLAALAWSNIDPSSYQSLWRTQLSIAIGGWGVSQELTLWVNNGLMTFFFFVVGLEARREFDIGELRQRRRVALPLLAGVGGMVVAIAIYLAVNAGRPSAYGWGVAMSTDTAFALGLLALVGPRFKERLRAFMLTVVVVDDLVSLAVIATVYSQQIALGPLVVAVLVFAAVLLGIALRVRNGIVYFTLGVAAWLALLHSGVDPLVSGLVMGLMAYAYPAGRGDLERATDLFRLFREQPTPELARSAQAGLAGAVSPNERLQQIYHPWTAYMIVPLFALANAGITINGTLLSRSIRSPVAVGTVLAYVVGKPLGIFGASFLATQLSRGRLRPPVGWLSVLGGGTIAGVGFTVSLLIASLAFRGPQLEEAKLGILTAALLASTATWLIFRAAPLLPWRLRVRALLGTAAPIVDLAAEVDPEHDHIRGPAEAPVTLVEYGDFECPYCGQAEPIVRELLSDFGDVRYVWRHLPLTDVHPNAQLAAEASEAAAKQGEFWRMHDLLLGHQDALQPRDLVRYAGQLGLDVDGFAEDLRRHSDAVRVAEDVESADLSGVSGTPTFFVNGRRHYGAYDIDALSSAVRLAGAQATLAR